MLTRGGGVPKRESEPYNEHHHGRQVHEPMDIGAEANFFTGLQHLSHVAHPLDLSSAPGKIKLTQGCMVPRSERVGEGYSDAQR